MKEISNAQRSILSTQSLIQAVGHWTLATAEPVHGEGGLDVERWAFSRS
jgi:hypothetical protein